MKTTKINHPTDTVPDGALVRAHGFPMLRKIEGGKTYLVKRDSERDLYWFCVPRTGRRIIGHWRQDVDFGLRCFPRGDNNCLEVFALAKEASK